MPRGSNILHIISTEEETIKLFDHVEIMFSFPTDVLPYPARTENRNTVILVYHNDF